MQSESTRQSDLGGQAASQLPPPSTQDSSPDSTPSAQCSFVHRAEAGLQNPDRHCAEARQARPLARREPHGPPRSTAVSPRALSSTPLLQWSAGMAHISVNGSREPVTHAASEGAAWPASHLGHPASPHRFSQVLTQVRDEQQRPGPQSVDASHSPPSGQAPQRPPHVPLNNGQKTVDPASPAELDPASNRAEPDEMFRMASIDSLAQSPPLHDPPRHAALVVQRSPGRHCGQPDEGSPQSTPCSSPSRMPL